MPPTYTTLATLLVVNSKTLADLNVSDLVLGGTVFSSLFAQPSSNGTLHSYQKEITAPVIGFRAPNEPANNQPGTNQNVTVTLQILDAMAMEDKAVADSYDSSHGAGSFMAKRGMQNLRSAFHTAEKQCFYGVGGGAPAGFTGLADALSTLANPQVVGAGGVGGDVESVWIYRTDEDNLSVIGNGDTPMTIGETVTVPINTYAAGVVNGQITGYMTPMLSWLGLQLGSIKSVVRVANCNVATGTNIMDKILDGLTLFPADRPATHIAMSRRARRRLQASLQAFSNIYIPTPRDVDDIPIIVSQALIGEAAIA